MASLNTKQSRDTAITSLRRTLDVLQLARGLPEDAPAWDTFPWEKIGPEETTYVQRTLIDRKFAPKSVQITMTVLRGVLKQCWRLGLMDADVYQRAIDLPLVGGERTPAGRMLTKEEIEKVITYVDTRPRPYGTMVAALFAAALGGGLRREELATVRANALEEAGLRVLGKGRVERVQGLPTWARERIQAWARERVSLAGVETLFLYAYDDEIVDRAPTLWSTWNLVVTVGAEAGVKHFTTHDLRRTFASRMIDNSDLSLARRAMRHKSASTTALYDRRDDSRVVDAIEKLEGFGFEKKRRSIHEEGKPDDMPKTKTIDVPAKGLATLGELVKSKGPTLSRAETPAASGPQKSTASKTVPDAAPAPRKEPERRKIKVGGQELVEAPRGRIVKPPLFRRNGLPLDMGWACEQAQKLAVGGKSHEIIRAALTKVGVRRADGSELEVADVTKLL